VSISLSVTINNAKELSYSICRTEEELINIKQAVANIDKKYNSD